MPNLHIYKGNASLPHFLTMTVVQREIPIVAEYQHAYYNIIESSKILKQKIDYIHANPIKKHMLLMLSPGIGHLLIRNVQFQSLSFKRTIRFKSGDLNRQKGLLYGSK